MKYADIFRHSNFSDEAALALAYNEISQCILEGHRICNPRMWRAARDWWVSLEQYDQTYWIKWLSHDIQEDQIPRYKRR
jgi:hypothetical protein